MKRDEYYAAIEAYKANRVEHGGEWKKHKYIRIENGRYIYPEDAKKSSSVGQKAPVALDGPIEKPEYESHRERADSYQTTNSYQQEAKKLADARAAGRKATQEYKSSGQYEKDVADEKAKVEKQKQAEANKKAFEESTKQLSPQEQYIKEQSEKKKAGEYSDYGSSDQIKDAVKADVNQLLFELTGGRITQGEDTYKTYRDNSVKAHDEYIQEGKKQGISSVVLNNIYGYEQCKAVLESLEKYNEMGLISQESYNMGKGLYEYNLKKFKSLPAVKAYIETGKMPKEVPGKEIKHSFSSPEEYRAAINAYKTAKRLVPR